MQKVAMIFLVFSSLVFAQCQSPDDSEKQTQTEQTTERSTQEPDDYIETDTSDQLEEKTPEKPTIPEKPLYPRLNDKNAEAFLREYGEEHTQNRILMETNYGNIELRLYDDTPLHRANFLYLIERGYYDPVEVTRIIDDFMIQGGNSQDSRPSDMRFLIGKYTVPPEFRYHHIHKKGALAMSRVYEENPDKRSSAYNFYIVDGRKIGDMGLFNAEKQRGKKYTDEQVQIYREVGGAAHLDFEHTVFGEVVKGMDVVEKISELPTDKADWPVSLVEVRMEVLD